MILIKCNVTGHSLAKHALFFALELLLISRLKKKKIKMCLPVLILTGALALSKIAATGGADFAAFLFLPFQRKSVREKLLGKPETRTVHTTVLHNRVAGKNCSSTHEPKDHKMDIARVLLESEVENHKDSLTNFV